MEKNSKNYDVFLSYRRDGGAEMAKHLRDSLTERGYRVFLDVESLRSGPFNTKLYRVIENSKDFLLILPPRGLDRCRNEDDWVRLEIEHARSCGKNIVPVMLRGFSFPEELPESLDFIRLQNGPTATDIEYYDAYVDRLTEFLQSKPLPKWKRRVLTAIAAVLVLALGLGLHYCLSTYPLTTSQNNLVSSLISYLALNMTQADLAGSNYTKELDRALQFIEGRTTDSEATVRYELSNYSDEIRSRIGSVSAIPEQMRQQLVSSPFDVGDLDAFKPVLTGMMAEYADHLDYICDTILPSDSLRTEHKSEYIKFLKGWSELDAEMLFYQMNDTLLPVTNEKALSTLKNEHLPLMSFLYAKRLDMTHDREALRGKEEAIFQQYEKLLSDYEESVQREAEYIDPQQIRAQIELLIQLRENQGLDTSELEERLQRILDKIAQIEQAKEEVIDLKNQLDAARAEAYEKFKPLEEDDLPTLWGKGKRFLTINMPSAAAECFALYAEKGDEEDKLIGLTGQKFAENYTLLDIKGGVVVCLYEEGLPHQAVEIGDVIYCVDGKTVLNYGDYSNAVAEDGIHSIRILRFTENGHELLDSVIDKSLGRIAILGLIDES